MGKTFQTEREGPIEFFDNFGIPYNDDDSILIDNTDGVFNGNILEFKLNINNLNKTLFQAIKYLSRMRIKGESVPATILLVSLNDTTVYVYKSKDYFDDIHKVYAGSASKNNDGFTAGAYVEKLNYSDMMDSSKVKKILTKSKSISEMYMPIDIDESCIVGWAERYYREKPKASKGDFLGDETGTAVKITGEIREPRHFKGLINPYTGKTNEKFKYLMDCLNDRLSKKDLGAFYTDFRYAKKAAELVKMAVDRVPEGNDYIILDRCCGTGNLEEPLADIYDKNGDSLISHCVVSTYEYYEYRILLERIGEKVRDVIPPTEANVRYENGKISNADAMSEEYINNLIIKQYIDDPKCTIILFENPPYRDESSGMVNGEAIRTGKKKSFVCTEMKKEVKGVATNDLSNQFIWSGFKYYMRQETDSYIVFAPIKYWKQYAFIEAFTQNAYLFNRKYFHATESAISVIYWQNVSKNQNRINFDVFDAGNGCVKITTMAIDKVFETASKIYSKLQFTDKDLCDVYCDKSGVQCFDKKVRVKGYMNNDIIGYLEADGFSIAPHVRNITRTCLYNGNGCYLTKDNYKNILPIWVAKHVPLDNWYEKDVYATTSDGGDKYTKDHEFLKSCLIYTCLSNQNKCLSFDGSDGRRYQNELCFDDSKIMPGMPVPPSIWDTLPLAYRNLKEYEKTLGLDDDEKELLKIWSMILSDASKTKNYNPEFNYGVYQITKELNTFEKIGSGKNKKTVYDYPELNGNLVTLRTKLKEYYKSHITDKMFEYELLK